MHSHLAQLPGFLLASLAASCTVSSSLNSHLAPVTLSDCAFTRSRKFFSSLPCQLAILTGLTPTPTSTPSHPNPTQHPQSQPQKPLPSPVLHRRSANRQAWGPRAPRLGKRGRSRRRCGRLHVQTHSPGLTWKIGPAVVPPRQGQPGPRQFSFQTRKVRISPGERVVETGNLEMHLFLN